MNSVLSFPKINYIFKTAILFFVLIAGLPAQSFYVEYDQRFHNIYKDIIDLKLEGVPQKIKSYKLENPYNLSSLHLDNYLDFFTLFINEDIAEFETRKKNKSQRIKALDNNLSDDNPYKRFLKAEIHLQWALTRSKFGELFKASREIYSAYNLLTQNQEEFPNFIYNKKSLSILHSLVETITLPGVVKSVLGLEGSIALAKQEIDDVIDYARDGDFVFLQEADAIKTFVLFYQANEKQEAWEFMLSSSLNPKESLLALFLVSKIAQRIGKNDYAIQLLEKRPSGNIYSQFYYLDYQLGLSKLRKLDPDAKIFLERFVNNFKGRHFIKEAYQKLAWSSLIFDNDIRGYKKFMALIKTKGEDLVDDDKQALRESKLNEIPNLMLLKARLLFDGGYYNAAKLELENNISLIESNTELYSEFNYRLGRISQELKMEKEAIKYFEDTIENGDSESYFVCNAALQTALIYEKHEDIASAKKYFRKCLSLQPKTYKRSLHQKAKTGLERIVE